MANDPGSRSSECNSSCLSAIARGKQRTVVADYAESVLIDGMWGFQASAIRAQVAGPGAMFCSPMSFMLPVWIEHDRYSGPAERQASGIIAPTNLYLSDRADFTPGDAARRGEMPYARAAGDSGSRNQDPLLSRSSSLSGGSGMTDQDERRRKTKYLDLYATGDRLCASRCVHCRHLRLDVSTRRENLDQVALGIINMLIGALVAK